MGESVGVTSGQNIGRAGRKIRMPIQKIQPLMLSCRISERRAEKKQGMGMHTTDLVAVVW